MERLADDNPGLVHPDDACPNCGQRDPDLLVWHGDVAHVRCAACGDFYLPPSAPPWPPPQR